MLKYEFDLCIKLKTITRFKIKKLTSVFLLILKMKFEIKLNKHLRMKKVKTFKKAYIEKENLNKKNYKKIINNISKRNIFIIKSIYINLT